jgi:hypothetical protein
MYREHLRLLTGHFKWVRRMEPRLTVEESCELLQLSEAIVDYGRMMQAYYGCCVPDVIVEIQELASRFRETPRTIKDALLLLGDMGRAEPVDIYGCWNLQLASTPISGGEGFHVANRHSRAIDGDNRDLGAA